ncbi:MAG: S8 family serine peptidase [Acidobacteria bacterium]|nr:S8 family serine peptidase [Acidobacteriota bacterium]
MLRTRRLALACVLMLAGMPALSQNVIEPATGRAPTPHNRPAARENSFIVQFAKGTPQGARALAAAQAGAFVRYNYAATDAIAVTVPNENALNSLRRNPSVVRIAPDFVVEAAVVRANARPGGGGGGNTPPPSLGFSTTQQLSYEVQRVGVPASGSDGTGIGVAVIDSGIDFTHPDLAPAGNTNATSFNAFGPGTTCQDEGGHGTHVAGLLAASNNSIGIVGVAPAAKLYCVRVLDGTLTGSDAGLMAGLDWVIQNRASVTPRIRVVNMSLGRPLDAGETLSNSALRPMIQALYNAGVVVVASAGNDSELEITQLIPAGFPEVLAVASTTANNGIRTCYLFGLQSLGPVSADTASGFTTDGSGVTVSAPGEERTDIVTLGSAGCVGLEYGTLSTTLGTGGVSRKLVPGLYEARGTSFSAPLVAGVVARVMQKLLVPATFDSAEVEGIRSWVKANANRKNVAPLDNPWAGVIYTYTFDGVREGIAQAPQ